MDKQSNSTTAPEISTEEHPWVKARRLSNELSAVLTHCDNAHWVAHVLPADVAPNVHFSALPMGNAKDELAVDRVNRLAWDLSEALKGWNGGNFQAMVLPSDKAGHTVMFSNIRAWDRSAVTDPETPQAEMKRLSTRMMEILRSRDPRTEAVIIRFTEDGTTVTSGFDIAVPGVDKIEDLFHRWKDAEARADASEDDEAAEPALVEYNALQDLIAEQYPRTAREFAMWVLAHTDRWAAGITDELRQMINVLAGEKEAA